MAASVAQPTRTRNAARSREAILAEAERLFAERGFDGASLQEVGEAAGLSRGAPGYLFGNKESLYESVLDRLFAERDAAAREAFTPLVAWARDPASGSLDDALTAAVGGYLQFLLDRPRFARVIQWEALAGGRRLRAAPARSRAAEDGFAALRRSARRTGLRRFDDKQAVVVFTSMCFLPVAYEDTFLRNVGLGLQDEHGRRRHVRLVVRTLTDLVTRAE